MECSVCKCEFSYPEFEFDKAFGAIFGGTPGTTCDDCAAIIINGSPEELAELMTPTTPTAKDEPLP